jgi:hypothetical protein
MKELELHAIALLLQKSYGADAVKAAVEQAKRLQTGEFQSVAVWERIAGEVSTIERLKGGASLPTPEKL